jgi:hypothetical protein
VIFTGETQGSARYVQTFTVILSRDNADNEANIEYFQFSEPVYGFLSPDAM